LVLALVALGIVVVEVVPRLASAGGRDAPTGDELVLRFGDPSGDADAEQVVEPEAVEGLDYHVVRRGETLSSIAELRYGDAAYALDLATLNGLDDPNALEVGQILRLQ
jgi:nucleoid-associated protein YgaU